MMRRYRRFRSAPTVPTVPAGHRAYVVGDVHGRLDLLRSLLKQIENDISRRSRTRSTIIFLGDLIDRGPDSAGVIELLHSYKSESASMAFIMGNHEEAMLRVIDGESDILQRWLTVGGSDCLQSYGMDPQALKSLLPMDAIRLVRAQVPPAHVKFMRSFSDIIELGNYVFVHAGIRPGRPLAEQVHSDLRWIREPFLSDEQDHGFVVVHGHTISETIDEKNNRIGIDTGAYRSGILTALCLEGTERWLLQTNERL